MADFNLVEPRGWEYDLQSVYTAFLGYFQLHNVPWYERSWGVFFETFEGFLTFSWPVITVTDCYTGKAHIVTRANTIGAFLKMIKTRFGETLPMVDNILRVRPFETSQRHLRKISDYASYRKLYSTLPAGVLSALKVRVRNGEPKAIRELWESRDKTFMAIDFEWSERNVASCLEWGYAAARCSHLDAVGAWPPKPEPNYRRGHYIVSEYVDKVHNKYRPNFPWAYTFGDSQTVPKATLPQVIQAVISSMASPDSETISNTLVLVFHGTSGDPRRLEEMKIKVPHNVLVIDTAAYERQLFASGQRGSMQDPTGKPRSQESTLSLVNLLQSLGVDIQCALNNSGNDAFLSLLGLQLLIDPEHTKIPSTRGKKNPPPHMMGMMGMGGGLGGNPMVIAPIAYAPSMPMMSPYGIMPLVSPPLISPGSAPPMNGHRSSSSGDFTGIRKTSSQMQLMPNSPNTPYDTRPRKISGLSRERKEQVASGNGYGVGNTNGNANGSGSGDGKRSSGPSSGTTSEDDIAAKFGGMKVSPA